MQVVKTFEIIEEHFSCMVFRIKKADLHIVIQHRTNPAQQYPAHINRPAQDHPAHQYHRPPHHRLDYIIFLRNTAVRIISGLLWTITLLNR